MIVLIKNRFNTLPVAAIVDEKIFCMHGGLSPELNHMDQVHEFSFQNVF